MKNEVENIQAAAYNGACKVYRNIIQYICIIQIVFDPIVQRTPEIEGEEPYGANAAYQQVLSSWLTCREKVSFLDKTLLFLQHNEGKVFL